MTSTEDFLAQCDNITANLPHFSDRFTEMTRDTQDMAQQLEERMRFLEDGYEHLGAVAGQIPKAFQELASGHRKSIMEAAHVLEIEDKENDKIIGQQLNYLKRELQSIAQERVVIDVFTRGTISRAKRHFTANKGLKENLDGEPAFLDHDRERVGKISNKKGGDIGLAATSAVRASTDGGEGPSLLASRRAVDSTAGIDHIQHGQDGQYNHGVRGGNVFSRMTRSELMSSITLPAFGQSWTGGAAASAAVASAAGLAPTPTEPAPQRTGAAASQRGPPIVRLVKKDAVIVPSMKQALPEEIAHLKMPSGPKEAPYDTPPTTALSRRSARSAKAATETVKSTIIPIAKALRAELRRNKQDMEVLRNQVHEAHKDMQAERVAARRVMRTVAAGLESHMSTTEEAIKAEVQSVVDGAFDRLTGALLEIKGQTDRVVKGVPQETQENPQVTQIANVEAPTVAQRTAQPDNATTPNAKVKPADPVTRFLLAQNEPIQYDKNGRRIVRNKKGTSAASAKVQYDQDGRSMRVGQDALPTSPRASPSPMHTHTINGLSPKSPKPWSHLTVNTGHPTNSPRIQPTSHNPTPTKGPTSPRGISPGPLKSPTQAPMQPSEAETFTDPVTGTVYKVLGVSDRGYTGHRSRGDGPFWGHAKKAAADKPVAPVTPAAPTVAAPAPANVPTPKGGVSFLKSLSIYQPATLPTPALNPNSFKQSETSGNGLLLEPPVTEEYSLVLTTNGVQWQATRVPIETYKHPDVNPIDRSGGGLSRDLATVLPPDAAPGDPDRPVTHTTSPALLTASEHSSAQLNKLNSVFGVVEGGGVPVVISGTQKFTLMKTESTLRSDFFTDADEEGTTRAGLSDGPLLAPPRPTGLPNPDIHSLPVPSIVRLVNPLKATPPSQVIATAKAAVSAQVTPFISENVAPFQAPVLATPNKLLTAEPFSEQPTENRSARPVAAMTNVRDENIGSLQQHKAKDDTEGGTADEVQTLESAGDLDAADDQWGSDSHSDDGEVRLSSSAVDNNSAVYSRPASPRNTILPQEMSVQDALKTKSIPISVENAENKIDPLVMKPLASPLGQKLTQVVPALKAAVTASSEAISATTATASAPIAIASTEIPAPAEFAKAMVDALRALVVAVAAPAAATAAPAVPSTDPSQSSKTQSDRLLNADEVALGIENGIEKGVRKVLGSLKMRASETRERSAMEQARNQRARAAAQRVQPGLGSTGVGAAEAADAVVMLTSASAGADPRINATDEDSVLAGLPHEVVPILELDASRRPRHVPGKSMAPLVSQIIGHRASTMAAALSIDSTSFEASLDDSADTVDKVFQNIRLAPGIESMLSQKTHNQRPNTTSQVSVGATMGSSAGVQKSQESQSYIFAGGDVSSSDDWTEVGVEPNAADDDLAALAALSLRDDSSFVEALRGGSGAARRLASPRDMTVQSMEDIEDIIID